MYRCIFLISLHRFQKNSLDIPLISSATSPNGACLEASKGLWAPESGCLEAQGDPRSESRGELLSNHD